MLFLHSYMIKYYEVIMKYAIFDKYTTDQKFGVNMIFIEQG